MEDETKDGVQTVETLSKQVENLNKGIAKYRDDATSSGQVSEAAKKDAAEAKAEVARLTKIIEEATGDDEKAPPKLNDEDQKKLEAWAKAQGFVTKKEMDEERSRVFNESIKSVEATAVDEFLKSHPEYDQAEEWAKITEEFKQYRQPTSITGYRQILSKIYKELRGTSDAAAQVRAEAENRKRLGLGGGSQGGAEEDTTLEDLQEKYPNLSREVIIARLEEINQVTSDRATKAKQKSK